MNERIFELAKQADLIQWDTLPSGARTPDHESVVKARKFAELIVRECAELCTDQYHLGDAGTGDGFGITAADIRCEKLIKKHFGVEE